MSLKVYATHWSDNKQRWGKPAWIDRSRANLNLPFGYLLAENQEKAEEFIKTIPPLPEMAYRNVEKPENFALASSLDIEVEKGTEVLYAKEW